VLAMAQAEALEMEASGQLKGEANSTCNPGEVSMEMLLSDPRRLEALQARRPGLYQCIRALWNLPNMLAPLLDLEMRVPQVVLLASYPPGALYHRHLDSYDGKDIPRLITVLLYLQYEPRQGGELRALNCPTRTEPWDISPLPGRLCIFYAQEIEHMVLPSVGQRFALTLWIWDVKKDSTGR
jgi:Rps23 Pro-64 3,4-dihydroxylase Tpa1-like proline 4-hydroxylase